MRRICNFYLSLGEDSYMASHQSNAIEESGPDQLLSVMAQLQTIVDSFLSNLGNTPQADKEASNLSSELMNISDNIARILNKRNAEKGEAKSADGAGKSVLRGLLTQLDSSHQITYCSQKMYSLIQKAERVAQLDAPVLLTGETGVGKELIARLIHKRSPRKLANWVPLNCAAITKELFESHLFGHKQGAFTGATRDQVGVVRAAAGGTLFLDEIGELVLDLQPKLLRFLQIGEIHTIGQSHPSFVNVRIVASTNRDLEAEVAAGRFRADLYYRLNSLSLGVPALRDRREDIPLLIEFFLNKYGPRAGDRQIRFTPGAMDCLMAFDWPGNVRELSNFVLRMIAFAESKSDIEPEDLPPEFTRPKVLRLLPEAEEGDPARADLLNILSRSESTLAESVYMLERLKVSQALACHKGNFAKAARQLGLSTFGLRKKYRRLFPQNGDTATVVSDEQPD